MQGKPCIRRYVFLLYGGILMIFVGVLLARPLLEMMGTPADVINLSVLYMRIYFIGMPAFILYDFGAAMLRAVGDTKKTFVFSNNCRMCKCDF